MTNIGRVNDTCDKLKLKSEQAKAIVISFSMKMSMGLFLNDVTQIGRGG